MSIQIKKIIFFLKVFLLVAGLLILIYSFVLALVQPQPQFSKLSYSERASNFFAFFTIQSNIIVVLWLLVSLWWDRYRSKLTFNHKLYYQISLAVVTYITITMLVFWIGIFGTRNTQEAYNSLGWISTISLHLFMPIGMITVFILSFQGYFYDYRRHHFLACWFIYAYLFFYFIITIFRGVLRQASNTLPASWFPYFFLNIYEYNIVITVIATIMISIGCVLFQYFYIWLTNMIYLKSQHIKSHVFKKALNNENKTNIPNIFSKRTAIGLRLSVFSSFLNLAGVVVFVCLSIFNPTVKAWRQSTGLSPALLIVFNALVATLAIISLVSAYFAFKRKSYRAQIVTAMVQIISISFNWLLIIDPIISLAAALLILLDEYKMAQITESPDANENGIIKAEILEKV